MLSSLDEQDHQLAPIINVHPVRPWHDHARLGQHLEPRQPHTERETEASDGGWHTQGSDDPQVPQDPQEDAP